MADSSRGASEATPPEQEAKHDAPRRGARSRIGTIASYNTYSDRSEDCGMSNQWFTSLVIWHLLRGAGSMATLTGGLRFAPTSGYFLATLRVGSNENVQTP